MTIQEAYNKGLDYAEDNVFEKISNAIDGNDVGEFANPKLELLRQRVLSRKPENHSTNYVLNTLLGNTIELNNLSNLDTKIVEILKYIRSLVGPKPRSRISVKIKQLITKLEVDFIRNGDKLN